MENESVKFSIVVPTFNRAELLREAISSIVGQTYENWELIVVDDGGTDDTKEMVSGFGDERIQYLWQENAERGAARNAGVQKSAGDYVFFLDSDDFILPGYLKYARELIGEQNPECLHIPYGLADGEMLKNGPNLKNIQPSLLRSNKFASQVILRKDVALKFPFSENRHLKIGEDWLLILQLTARFQWVIGTKMLGRIRQHEKRTMYFPTFETVEISKAILKKELAKDEKYANHPTIFRNIDLEFEYLEMAALIHKSAPKSEIDRRLRKMIFIKPAFLFSRRFLFVMKHLILPK